MTRQDIAKLREIRKLALELDDLEEQLFDAARIITREEDATFDFIFNPGLTDLKDLLEKLNVRNPNTHRTKVRRA